MILEPLPSLTTCVGDVALKDEQRLYSMAFISRWRKAAAIFRMRDESCKRLRQPCEIIYNKTGLPEIRMEIAGFTFGGHNTHYVSSERRSICSIKPDGSKTKFRFRIERVGIHFDGDIIASPKTNIRFQSRILRSGIKYL